MCNQKMKNCEEDFMDDVKGGDTFSNLSPGDLFVRTRPIYSTKGDLVEVILAMFISIDGQWMTVYEIEGPHRQAHLCELCINLGAWEKIC